MSLRTCGLKAVYSRRMFGNLTFVPKKMCWHSNFSRSLTGWSTNTAGIPRTPGKSSRIRRNSSISVPRPTVIHWLRPRRSMKFGTTSFSSPKIIRFSARNTWGSSSIIVQIGRVISLRRRIWHSLL